MFHRQKLCAYFLVACFAVFLLEARGEDLYKVLGVAKTATIKEIKTAYRRKALNTHPDKNKNVPPEQAAAAFHKVVHAFEVLSDAKSRRSYDQSSTKQQNQQGFRWSPFFQQRQQAQQQYWQYTRFSMKDRFDVKEAQSRVMHIVSLEQLKTVMLDDDERLERNLLLCFVTPKEIETIADDRIFFPYPFAAMSTQGIWWEDLLQTAKIRYNNRNSLSKFFDIPQGKEMRQNGSPIFVFGRRGEHLSTDLPRLQTSDRATFEKWVWKMLEVEVVFVNHHDHPVELYWVHDNSGQLSGRIEPNETHSHTTMLSHEFLVRDARVDSFPTSPGRYKLAQNTLLGSWKITSDVPLQELIIQPKICLDLSGHCEFWARDNQCSENPNFMGENCRMTCKLCSDEDNNKIQDERRREREMGNHNDHEEMPADGFVDEL
jgi:hypothetical protein